MPHGTDTDHNIDLSTLTRFELVSMFGRWSVEAGGKPSVDAGSPSSRELNGDSGKKRARKQRIGKDEIWTTADVDLGKCMSGEALVAYWRNGSFAMPLTQRVKKTPLPDEEMQKRYTGAKWKLRGTRLIVCGWIAYAMVGGTKRRACEALVLKHSQLAEVCELRDPDWLADCLHDLRAWGLVRQDCTWVQHGKASSRRGNVYRLTKLAAYAFGLEDRLDVARLPDPEPIEPRTPRIARNRTRASAPGNPPTHPENTSDLETLSALSLSSTRAREAAGSVVSTSSTVDCHTAVADESLCLPSLERVKTRPVTFPAGSFEPESREAARRVADVVPRVMPSAQSDARGEPSRRRDGGHGNAGDRERAAYERAARKAGVQRELAERRAERERAAAARAERELADRDAADVDAPPPDDWGAVAAAALEQERRAELARYSASLTRTNTPLRRKSPDEDERDTLEQLEASCRLRGMHLPTELAFRLEQLRKGGAS